MGPTQETCIELLRPLRALVGLKQVAIQRASHESLHHAAFGLLAELAHRGECRAAELAQYRFVDASVVSRQLAQLEQAGLITRRPDPTDRRVALLSATPEGKRELTALEQRRAEFLGHALRDWEDEDLRKLADLLTTVQSDLWRAACEHSADLTTKEGAR